MIVVNGNGNGGGKAARVLRAAVVDDNEGMRETMRDVLQIWGVEVETADCGESALALFGRQTFDIAFVDFMMPGMDGIALIQRLRPAHPDTRFVLLTAYTENARAQEAVELDGIELAFKPVDLARLHARVKDLLAASPVVAEAV